MVRDHMESGGGRTSRRLSEARSAAKTKGHDGLDLGDRIARDACAL